MCTHDTLPAKRGELYRIAGRNKADRPYVFGSCARQEEPEDSDVDFLVLFRKDASLLGEAANHLSVVFSTDAEREMVTNEKGDSALGCGADFQIGVCV